MRNSGKEYSILLTAEELEKVAADESYKKEMLNKAERLIDFSNRINKKYGFTSAGRKKVLLQASSENELLNMIEKLDWSKVTENKMIF